MRLLLLLSLLIFPGVTVFGQEGYVYLPVPVEGVLSETEPWDDLHRPFAERMALYMLQLPGLTRRIDIDSTTSAIMIRQLYRTTDVRIPLIMDVEEYALRNLEQKAQASFQASVNAGIENEFREGQEGNNSLGFSVPFPVQSETFQKVFGGSGVSLNVKGQVNLQASALQQKEDAVKDALNRGSDLQFKLEQQQRFNIEGKVGEKVSILVDQDSERDFDFDNNMRIFYTGEEDEVVKTMQAGNVALSLPGTQFVTFSGSNQGLFGLKSEFKVGPIDMTSIASLEKGEKQKLSLQGGQQTNAIQLHDYNYLGDMYFFLDKSYRDQYGINSSGLLNAASDPIEDITVWEAADGYHLQNETIEGWALADPNNPVFDNTTYYASSRDQKRAYFKRLVDGQDYVVFNEIGYVFFNQPVRDKIIAVGYRTRNQVEYGDIVPPDSTREKPFTLKMIRTQRPAPADATFDLMWKHVYTLGMGNVPLDGLFVRIVDTKDPAKSEVNPATGTSYIDIFGLDQADEQGNPGPDNKADVWNINIFNPVKGHLIFPRVDPFNTDKIPVDRRTPQIYDTLFVNNADWSQVTKFDIEVETSMSQATYNLGFNTLPGSEEVVLDGRQLQKGVDYDIDYTFGTLTVKNSDALKPGANLDIRYESGQLFQLDKKTLMGARAEYKFWENSFIGATAIRLSESILESRVKIGQEPVSNMVWDINGRIDYEPEMLTNWLNALPLVATDQPSRLVLEAELGQIMPNPNTLNSSSTGDNSGVAFVDDFEASKRENLLTLARRSWLRSSVPLIPPVIMPGDSQMEVPLPIAKLEENRGKLLWYNPQEQVPTNHIYPAKETNSRTGQLQNVITLERRFDDLNRPYPGSVPDDQWWGGITSYLPVSFQNQSDVKFIEFMVQGTKGIIHFEMGQISEDINGDGLYQTEDFYGKQAFENGILDQDDVEDLGIHGPKTDNFITDGTGGGELYDDDWHYTSRSNYYLEINGTEQNGTGDNIDGLRIPDSEDLSRNGNLDTQNDYFSFTINLDPNSPEYQKYLAGGTIDAVDTEGNDAPDRQWRLFRVPIRDFTFKIGNPDVTRLEFARIWVEGLDEPSLYGTTTDKDGNLIINPNDKIPFTSEAEFGSRDNQNNWNKQAGQRQSGLLTHMLTIASISFISSDWKEESQIVALDENLEQDPTNFVAATVVNTEENPVYKAPPGVKGVEDRLTGVQLREQSLVLKYQELPPNNAVALKKALMEITDIVNYEQLKMYVHGPENIEQGDPIVVIDDSITNVEFFMRLGRDEQNFYEVRGYLFPGWDSSIPYEDVTDPITGQDRNEIIIPVNRLATLTDSLTAPEWGGGKQYRKVGSPTIRQLQIMTLGVINRDQQSLSGEVWFDELRVSQVDKARGKALRAKVDLTLADLGIISTDYTKREADFHTVNEKKGTGMDTETRNLTAQVNVARLISSEPAWSIPVSYTMTNNLSTPKYLTGTDVLYELAVGDSNNTREDIQKRNITEQTTSSMSFALTKARESKHWWLKYTIDKVSYNFSRNSSSSSDFNTRVNDNASFNHGLGWSIAFPRKMLKPFGFFGEKTFLIGKLAGFQINFIPNGLTFNSGLTENTTASQKYGGLEVNKSTAALTRTMSTGLQLFPNLSMTFSQSYNNDLTDSTRHTTALYAIANGRLGQMTTKSQSLGGNFSPKIFGFLTHTLSYQSSYGLNNNYQMALAGKSVQNSSTITGRAGLNLAQMLGLASTGAARGPRQPAPRRPPTRPGAPGEEPPKEEEEGEGGGFFLWNWSRGLAGGLFNRISPINASWSQNQAVQNVGLTEEPGWMYRIGLDKNPFPAQDTTGMGSSPQVVGTQQNSVTNRTAMGAGSGFRLISSMRLTFKYDVQESESFRGTSQTGNRTKTVFLNGTTPMPIPNWSFNWTGLEKIWPFTKMFQTLSLDHAYNGDETTDMRTTFTKNLDGSKTESFEPTQQSYNSSYSPWVRVTMQWKGAVSSQFNMTKQTQFGRDLIVGTESKTEQSNMTFNTTFSKSDLKIPIPFFNKRLTNTVNFNFNFDMNESATFRQDADGNFAKSGGMNRWNARTEIGYSLTSKVTGRMHFQLGKSTSEIQGSTNMKDFGFSVDIRIEGSGT